MLIMLDHIGDVLWKTPTIATLRKNLPEAEITALLTPYTREVLEGNPALDELFIYDPKISISADQKKESLAPLREKKFDLAISLDPRDEAGYLALLSGAPRRVGFFYPDQLHSLVKMMFTLTHRFVHPAWLRRNSGSLPHEVEANLNLIARLGFGTEPVTEISLVLEKDDLDFAKDCLKDRQVRIALHLEPKWFSDSWGGDFFLSLLGDLEKTFPGDDFLITYGPGSEELAKELLGDLGDKFLIKGRLSVKQWAALLSKAKLLICRDGGAAHVAAAVKTGVVTIFEQEKFQQHKRWVPWGTEYSAVFREDEKGKDEKYLDQHQSELIKAVEELL